MDQSLVANLHLLNYEEKHELQRDLEKNIRIDFDFIPLIPKEQMQTHDGKPFRIHVTYSLGRYYITEVIFEIVTKGR
jgi:hypothetical protein